MNKYHFILFQAHLEHTIQYVARVISEFPDTEARTILPMVYILYQLCSVCSIPSLWPVPLRPCVLSCSISVLSYSVPVSCPVTSRCPVLFRPCVLSRSLPMSCPCCLSRSVLVSCPVLSPCIVLSPCPIPSLCQLSSPVEMTPFLLTGFINID